MLYDIYKLTWKCSYCVRSTSATSFFVQWLAYPIQRQ